MTYYNENFGSRIVELLNYPLIDRLPEIGILIDGCSIRELQEVFPSIINSIFGINSGGLGWGLRTITKENSSEVFDILLNFFTPLGPMFRLCYRLLNDAFKFELSIDMLPQKLNEMLMSGNYSLFYADLIQIDPFRRSVSSLTLNAFDYYMLNFVIHGTLPLHRIYPAALQVHNEKSKTAYFLLSAEYMSFFLPSSPDAVVLPTNICGTVKAPQPVPVQPLQPTKSPKYLKLSPLSHFGPSNQSNSRSPESPRAHAWRTESVLYFFVDTWMRFNVSEMRDLPSSEFVRAVRILIKQLHAFGSSADFDNTSMAVLRKLALPMMKARIYPFIKGLIARWPLDSSLIVVLELWLSYIQPWRYYYTNVNGNVEMPVVRYESFIFENLIVYTQIFIEVLYRFERLDFTSHRNVMMLHRIAKVFSQQELPQILRMCEQRLINPLNTSSPSSSPLTQSISYQSNRFHSAQTNIDNSSPTLHQSIHSDSVFEDENYIPLFSERIRNEIKQFIKIIYIAKSYVNQDIEILSAELGNQKLRSNIFKRIFMSFFEQSSPLFDKLNEIIRIPDILELEIHALGYIFDINLSEIVIDHIEPREMSFAEVEDSDDQEHDIRKLSPIQMKNKAANIKATIDPALIPIQSHECTVLVRFLHQVSCKLNVMFQNEIISYWNRRDIWGKLARQILYPPMITEWFDKSKGISELCQEELPPRICLRTLASYKTLFLMVCFLAFGHLIWGYPSFGLFILTILTMVYLFIKAIISH